MHEAISEALRREFDARQNSYFWRVFSPDDLFGFSAEGIRLSC